MSEQFTPISSLQLRKELHQMVTQDLLGPAGGEYEEVEERNVRGRYILGLLAPKGQTFIPDEQDDAAAGGNDDAQDGKSDTVVPQMASMLPSSIGLTFTVAGSAQAVEITAHWGYYRRSKSETLVDDKGGPKTVWRRWPVVATSPPIPLQAGKLGPWFPQPDNEEVYVRGLCRQRDGSWTITLFLINAQKEPPLNKDEAWLFQPELTVRTPDGAPNFIKRPLPPELNQVDDEDRTMQMLYRRTVEFAVGHGVATEAELAFDRWDRAVALKTVVLPGYEVERMEPPRPADMPALAGLVLDMKSLAELPDGGFGPALAPLITAYAQWLEEQRGRVPALPDLHPYQNVAHTALEQCQQTLARIQDGIALLDQNPQAAQAFRFANQAMHRQRVRSLYAGAVRRGDKPDLETLDVPRNRSWRPFQLAFLLLNLPGLADPTHPDRSDPLSAFADLLWFPTGGGKTEAYLGVAAFTMAIRRLQGELGGLSGQAGVTVLMRYTLRLLTLQQFQRATTLMAACEIIRQEDPATWGDEPFRIGLWVGQKSTPNWTKDAAEVLKHDHGEWSGGTGGKGTPYQLTNCPWCGHPIDPGKHIRVQTPDVGHGRTFQYCGDPQGQCPFSYRQSPGEGLPIVVVDEEIYRRLPTLLIATVDKFAQLPWKGETQMLFGRVNGYCPRHGYRSPDLDDSDSHPRKGSFEAVKTKEVGWLRPPDLIIQDELHLISGPLGTLVGLYETVVDELCTWEMNGQTVRAKVIASTATIRRAQDQVNSLFLRQVKVFPPSGLEAEDNFFARQQPSSQESPGRLYLGVCAPGTRMRTILLRVYTAYMAAAQALLEKYGAAADPYMTLIGYFNSMRELGGMRRVVDDSLRTRLQRMNERGLSKRFITTYGVEELTSRKGATDIPRILDQLETPFSSADPKARKEAGKGKYPLDVVLATNMISVGVDVSRLGLMVVAGQPKATAEYIQATSRVGRAFPGIVCTVYNWARPRDLSHYERFGHYHATFYQQVEALSVTPFSPRALDRGLSGVLAASVRLHEESFNGNQQAGKVKIGHPLLQKTVERISQRAGLVTGRSDVTDMVRAMLKTRLDDWLFKAGSTGGGAILGYMKQKDGRTLGLLKQATEPGQDLFTCLNSLRDVEPSAYLILRDYGMDYEPGQPVPPTDTGE